MMSHDNEHYVSFNNSSLATPERGGMSSKGIHADDVTIGTTESATLPKERLGETSSADAERDARPADPSSSANPTWHVNGINSGAAGGSSFDDIIDRIRPFGAWQKRIIAMNMVMVITAGIHLLSYPMLTGRYDYWCRMPQLSYDNDGGLGSAWSMEQKRLVSTPANPDFFTEYERQCKYYGRTFRQYPSNSTFAEVYEPIHDFVHHAADVSGARSPYVLKECSLNYKTWVFSSPYYGRSLKKEFNLVCSRLYLEAFVHTAFAIGCMVGVLVFGWMADTMGRRRVIIITTPGILVLSFLLSLANSMPVFLVIRALQGMVVFGNLTVMLCITMESTSPSRRAFVGNLVYIPWGAASIIVALAAYGIHNWRGVEILLTAISLMCLLFYSPLLPESARWLTLKGRYEPAIATLAHAAAVNGVSITNEELMERLQKVHDAHVQQAAVTTVKLRKTLSLLFVPELRYRTLLVILVWFQCALANHGINFYAPRLATNPFVAYAMLGIGEALAPAVGMFVFTYGRRLPVALLFVLSAILCLFMLFFVKISGALFMLAVLVASFVTDMSYRGATVHTAELFPTTVRSFGLGVASSAAYLGSALSSFIVMTSDRVWWAPPLLFMLALLGSALCTWCLPETKQLELPETIEDIGRQQAAAAAQQHQLQEHRNQQQQVGGVTDGAHVM